MLAPVEMLLFVKDKLLDHVLCYIIVLEQRERLAHHRERFCGVLAVILQHFLDIGHDRMRLRRTGGALYFSLPNSRFRSSFAALSNVWLPVPKPSRKI